MSSAPRMNAFLQDIYDSYFCENKEKDTPQIWELTLCVPSSGDGGCWAWSRRGLDRSEHVQVHSSLSYPAALHFSLPVAGAKMADRYGCLCRLEGREVWFM